MPPESPNTPQKSAKPSRAPQIVGGVTLAIYVVFLIASFSWKGGWISELLRDHYVFFVGLPFAALIAYFLVSTLESAKGKVEFEALGMKFKGASGPIVMWVLVFLSLIVAIRLVWGLK
jgi:hypothetical protein